MNKIQTIRNKKDIQLGLKHLAQLDKKLKPIIAKADDVPLRIRSAGFESLCQIVVSQQLSVASADAIWSRLVELVNPFSTKTFSSLSDEKIGSSGISRPKIKTLRAIIHEIENGLDLKALTSMEPDDAHAKLCSIWGIGRWSADIYLLFCAGHPDIFPSGDIALQHAVTDVLKLKQRPTVEELDQIASVWSPWRGVAARLFWVHYRSMKKGREVMPL